MEKKSDIVRAAVREQDWKKALLTAKDFRIGVTQEQRNRMARAYECIVHPDFYKQIGVDIAAAIEQGKAVVKEYAESRRKNSMKWDVKHDKAKRVIDMFLEGADAWQKTGEFAVPNREDLTGDLTEEDRALVRGEVASMIASIRRRYKLQERLPELAADGAAPEIKQEAEPAQEAAPETKQEAAPETKQEAQIQPEEAGVEIPTGEAEETLPGPVSEAGKEEKPEKETAASDAEHGQKTEEKPKRSRKASGTEKKPATKRGRKKKTEQEENAEAEQATA